jgi:hypothetical protein
MPVFMKIDGIDSVGRQESVKDGTSNTLMIGEHVLTSVSHAATDVLDELSETAGGGVSVLEFSVENFPNNSPSPAPGESVSFQGFGIDRGHMGRSFDLVFPTQTAFPEVSGLKIEQDVIELSPDQAVSVIAIIAPVDLNEVDVGHADLLFSENAPGGAGCSVYICGQNSPQASPEPVTHAGWGHLEIVLDGSSPANTGYANPSSFQIASAGPSPLESDYSGAHALYQDVMIV